MAFGAYGFVESIGKWHSYVLDLLAGSVAMLAGDYAALNACNLEARLDEHSQPRRTRMLRI
jgi:hypothetical protein